MARERNADGRGLVASVGGIVGRQSQVVGRLIFGRVRENLGWVASDIESERGPGRTGCG